MNRMYGVFALFLVSLMVLGCRDDDDGTGDSKNGENGENGGNGNNSQNGIDGDGNWDGEGPVCYDATPDLTNVATRVMLLEDASLSMNDNNKWSLAVDAITGMVQTFEESIEFGFDMFPSGGGFGGAGGDATCAVGESVMIDVALNNASNIVDTLNRSRTNGATPLLLAMYNFTSQSYAPVFLDGRTTAYLVIISDGQDTCASNGVYNADGGASSAELAEVTRNLRETYGTKTFVIGFGEGADPEQLNAIAGEGGTPFTTFLNASNGDELAGALNQIGETVVESCAYNIGTYDLDNVDLDAVFISIGDEIIKRSQDCTGGVGWRWTSDDREVIEFCEKSCELLETGAEVVVKIACGGPVV